MKILFKTIVIFLFTMFIVHPVLNCNESNQKLKLKPLSKEEANAKSVWKRITKETNYTTYNYWPGQKGIRRGQSPHGAYHRIYINSVLYNNLPIKNNIAPYGSFIIKENYSPEKQLLAITLMTKIKDYNPEHNDWFWAKYSPNGEILTKGKEKEGVLNSCIKCHQGMKDNDYVIVHPLDKKIEE